MLHARIIDITNDKISIASAEKFISSSKFGASIFLQELCEMLMKIKK